MTIVGFRMMTAWLLLVMLMGLGVCKPAPAANPSWGQTTSASETSSSMPQVYQRWLDEDVCWIITPDERAAFLRLSRNQERDSFVKQFWLRRDPTPGTARNEFKEEHYRRIAYANEHFASGIPGWKTDRGRIYIIYGPPDAIKVESGHDGGESLRPTELWHYHSTTGPDKDFKFFDVCGCGDFRLQVSPKDAP